jgi:hypothetical protein
MDRINTARVVIGGLAAGLVINIGEFLLNGVFFAADVDAAMARLQLPPVASSAIGVFMALGFVLGIAMIWLYAAIRPRFGAGMTTAVYAGTAVWGLAYLYPSIGMAMMGVFPSRMVAVGVIWGLIEVCLGAVVGAFFYQEEPTHARVAA